jgi:ligand-binding sensor domain-containing protein
VNCIYEGKSGILWLGAEGGALQYNARSLTQFPIPAPDSSEIAGNFALAHTPRNICGILEDSKGNVWFATGQHGIWRYNLSSGDSGGIDNSFTHFLHGEVLQCIAEDVSGNILAGSWRGNSVYRYNGKAFSIMPGFSDGMIFCMYRDKSGKIWVGTRDAGVDRYDRQGITNFSLKDGLLNTNVSSIFEDSNGNMWFGSDYRNAGSRRGDVYRYDGKTFTNITGPEKMLKFTDYNVRSIVEDNAGNIWLGSRNGLLLRYDGKSFTDFSDQISR